jgi:hypothetical protein
MTTQFENAMPTSTLNHHACLEWFRVPKINTCFCDSHVSMALKKWFCFVILTHHLFLLVKNHQRANSKNDAQNLSKERNFNFFLNQHTLLVALHPIVELHGKP